MLQLLILALFLFALAAPIPGGALIQSESIIVIVDGSASMKTVEGKQPRFEIAKDKLIEIIASKGHEDEMMIIVSGGSPEIACPFTHAAGDLKDAAERITPSNESANLAAAFELAQELLSGKKHPLIYILSDGSGGEIEKILRKCEYVSYEKVGEVRDNLGILAFEARKNTGLMSDFLFARIKNFSNSARTASLSLYVDGELRSAEKVELGAEAELSKTFPPFVSPDGALVKLKLEPGDAFHLDDEAYAVMRPSRSSRVILVTPRDEELYFRGALEAMGSAIDPQSPIVSPEEYSALPPERKKADVTILNSCALPLGGVAGNIIAVNLTGDDLPVKVSGVVEKPVVTEWQRDNLITRYITFTKMFLKSAQKVAPRMEGKVILRSDGGPLMLLFEEKRKIVYLAFNIMDTDMPFRIAFPTLLRNILSYFEEEETSVFETSYQAGEAVYPLRRLSDGISEVKVTRLSAEGAESVENVNVTDGYFLFANTSEVGYPRDGGGRKHASSSRTGGKRTLPRRI